MPESAYTTIQNVMGTDQPGRFLAVFIISPILLYKGYQYRDWFIMSFAIILFLWDLYWLLMEPARTHIQHNKNVEHYKAPSCTDLPLLTSYQDQYGIQSRSG